MGNYSFFFHLSLVGLLIAGLWAHLAGWSAALVVFIKRYAKTPPLSAPIPGTEFLPTTAVQKWYWSSCLGSHPVGNGRERLGKWSSWRVDAPSLKKKTNMEAKNDGVEHEFPLKQGVMFRFHVGFWGVYVLFPFLWRSC